MSHALAPASGDASILALAKETETSTDVVKAIYDAEFARLSRHATIQQFIGVIATRIVRRRLREI